MIYWVENDVDTKGARVGGVERAKMEEAIIEKAREGIEIKHLIIKILYNYIVRCINII